MFSIKESINYGWVKTKQNFWRVVGIAAIIMAPSFVTDTFSKFFEDSNNSPIVWISLAIITIALTVLSIIIRIGSTKLFLQMHDGEMPPIKNIFLSYGIFWRFIGVSILVALIVIGGTILLIVPGIIFSITYSFAGIILIDTKIGPMAALRESAAISKGSKWKLLGFFIILGLINVVGFLALGIGLLVTIPISMFAWIHVYRKLSQAKASVGDKAPTELAPAA